LPLTALGISAIAVAAVSTFLHLHAEYRGPRWRVYAFKPLATFVLLLAAAAPAAHGSRYQLAVVAGLACSLVGDVLLMLPSDRFVAGLASFLLAHLAYVAAFTSGVALGAHSAILLPLLLAVAILLRVLWNGLTGLRAPVLLYAAAIVVMAWSAWARVRTAPGPGALTAAAGATLFMLSDALLALNRFRRPFRSAQAWIMATYVAAQTLISLSVSIA
jgi:uncharacterized membrane protein YhhN